MLSKEQLKKKFAEIMSLDAHPGHISAGFAAGVFISFTPPIPGLHTGLALAISFLFRLNKLTCITGSWINSPLTIVPSMILSYKLGAALLGVPPKNLDLSRLEWEPLKVLLVEHSKPLLLGCSIIGFVASMLAYGLCYWLIIVFRRKDAALAEITREMEVVGEELE